MVAIGKREENVVESPSSPKPISLYRPELDAVRLLAFFLVFVHHNIDGDESNHVGSRAGDIFMAIARMSGFGLSLFFVLSAYLISDLLIREKESRSTIDIKAFYKRRILRIWPLYIFGLLLGWGLSLRSGQAQTTGFLSFFLLLGNWYTVRHGFLTGPMGPLWSISIEEQFYVFWPSVVRKFTKRGVYMICAILLFAANLLLIYFGFERSSLDDVVWCNTFVEFEMFAAGILLALWLKQKTPELNLGSRALILGGAGICWFVSAQVFKPINHDVAISPFALVPGYGLIAIGCDLILIAALGIPARLIPKWIAYLGRISFGLYVFHMLGMQISDQVFGDSDSPPIQIAHKAIGLGLTVAMAAISYRYLETPFLRIKRRLEVIRTNVI